MCMCMYMCMYICVCVCALSVTTSHYISELTSNVSVCMNTHLHPHTYIHIYAHTYTPYIHSVCVSLLSRNGRVGIDAARFLPMGTNCTLCMCLSLFSHTYIHTQHKQTKYANSHNIYMCSFSLFPHFCLSPVTTRLFVCMYVCMYACTILVPKSLLNENDDTCAFGLQCLPKTRPPFIQTYVCVCTCMRIPNAISLSLSLSISPSVSVSPCFSLSLCVSMYL